MKGYGIFSCEILIKYILKEVRGVWGELNVNFWEEIIMSSEWKNKGNEWKWGFRF